MAWGSWNSGVGNLYFEEVLTEKGKVYKRNGVDFFEEMSKVLSFCWSGPDELQKTEPIATATSQTMFADLEMKVRQYTKIKATDFIIKGLDDWCKK